MPLTELRIQAIKPAARPQKITDADGLYLYVLPSGTKSWRMDYTFAGKRFTYTLGKFAGGEEINRRFLLVVTTKACI